VEAESTEASIDLYWLPLGAGGNFVRLNGRIYEALKAYHERRRSLDLYTRRSRCMFQRAASSSRTHGRSRTPTGHRVAWSSRVQLAAVGSDASACCDMRSAGGVTGSLRTLMRRWRAHSA